MHPPSRNPPPSNNPPLPPPLPLPSVNNSLSSSPSKRQRVASAGANNNNNDSSTTTTNHNNNNNQGNEESNEGTNFNYSGVHLHNVKVNLFGSFCASCPDQPLFTTRGPNLWIPTRGLLGQHWKAKKCFPLDTPNARKAERDLKAQQIQLHNQLQQSSQQQVDTLIAAEFPAGSHLLSGKFFYCINCGFFQKKRSDMNAHFGGRTNQMNCNLSQHLREGGEILVGVHGMKCPRAIVELVRQKQFNLPYQHAPAIVQSAARTPAARRQAIASQQHYSEYFHFDIFLKCLFISHLIFHCSLFRFT